MKVRPAAIVVFAAALSMAGRASAEPPANDPAATYRYTTPYDTNYFRAVLEGVGVLGIGFMEYLVSTKQSRGVVQPAYDWSIFRDKLGGNAQSFDVNRFNTNFVGHPIGGTLYYLSARANHLTFLESFAWAFTGSAFWEYIGEITEKPSFNDMIVTPWAGISNGEVMTQLGSFFARGKPGLANTILGAFFDAPRAAHDAVDGLEPERAPHFDALGFPTDIWHRFEFSLGGGVTTQQASRVGPRQTYVDERLRLDAELVNLPDYDAAGKHARTFSDGNLANLHFDMAISGGHLVDANFVTRATLAGYYTRDAHVDAKGRLRGDASMVGYFVGFEYGTHDFDRDRAGPLDQAALVSVGGLATEYKYQIGPFRLRAQLRASADFAGVHAYAIDDYVRKYKPESLPVVLRNEEYYFAGGPALTSRVDLSLGAFDLGGELRVNEWVGILGLDDDQSHLTNDVPRADRRVRYGAWAAYRFASDHLRLAVDAAELVRSGNVGEVTDRRSETTVTATLGAVF